MDISSEWLNDGQHLQRRVDCSSFMAGIDLVTKVAAVAEEMDHHPDITISWTTVTFTLRTHSANAVTELDYQLAEKIDALVAAQN